jgi:hypothetical protein
LDYLEKGAPLPAVWRAQQLAAIDLAAAPHGDLLIMVAGPIRQLVEASGTAAPGP